MEEKDQINRTNLLKATGIVLKEVRRKSSMSQVDLSNNAKVAKNTISNIENGRKSPTVETLFRLFTHLEIDISKYIELVRRQYIHLEEIDTIYRNK